MKRNVAMRIFCIVLAVLVGAGALGGSLYAVFSGSSQQNSGGTPLFMYNDQLYLVTDQSVQAIEEKNQTITVESRIKDNVIPQKNGESNFCPVGDIFVYTDGGDLYFPYNAAYLLCIPVTTNPEGASDE
ncbi:hypothetical protein [Fumia xinanensis]|uniref:Uncharacterized protein n=1 Tax=Fumia xinanensis TaxID=2763659 RepID=A0A926I8G6_9FIRM|nr:hypothetical protein [Fumia xinanensis]MBC8560969.1 hypothetical protein [Fumia xinanensis]